MAGFPAISARVSASRKVKIVLASGTGSDGPEPKEAHERKRMKESLSVIRNSVRSSDSEWLAWRISTLNMKTRSNGGRPPFDPSERDTERARSSRNSSKSTMRLNRAPRVALGREILLTLIDVEKPG